MSSKMGSTKEMKKRTTRDCRATIIDYEIINEITKAGQDVHAEKLPEIFAIANHPLPTDYFKLYWVEYLARY